MEINSKLNIISGGFLLLLITLFMNLPVHSQEAQLKILIFDFEIIGGNQKYQNLEKELPIQLKNHLNQSIKINIDVERLEDVEEKISVPEAIIGYPTDDEIKAITDSVKTHYNYILVGRFWEKLSILRTEIRLIDCQTGRIDFTAHAQEGDTGEDKSIQERITEDLSKSIEMYLTGRIRIGLIDFKMTGGDSSFIFLEESIPTMLATGLSASRLFKLIETKTENLLKEIREEGRHGIFDPSTMLEVAHKINANYLIMGEFWELDNKIRIDARCINIETGEIILSEGINLEKVGIDDISTTINELASKIRLVIEKDYIKKGIPTKSIAVISFPPTPNNKKNRMKADHIRKTLIRKLRLASKLRVKDNPQRIEKYMIVKEDKLKICSTLGVSSLLSFQIEDYEDDFIIFDTDVYDTDKPSQELYTDTRTIRQGDMNKTVNHIVNQTLLCLGHQQVDEIQQSSIEAIKVPAYYTRWSFGFNYAFVKRHRTGEDLYLKGGFGDYFEVFLNYSLSDYKQIEFQAGFDIGNSKKTVMNADTIQSNVRSSQASLLYKHKLFKTSAINLYAGLGGSFYMIYRNSEDNKGDEGHAGTIGGGVLALMGIEIKIKAIESSLHIEPRYILGTKISETSKNNFHFPGGKIGGFYLTIGIGYHFNL